MGLDNQSKSPYFGRTLLELNIRNYQRNGWSLWLEEFLKHVGPSFDDWPNSRKVGFLLGKMGSDAYYIFQTFNVSENVSFEELVQLFDDYFSPLFSRYKFFTRKQKANESFDQFADALTMLSFPCSFGSLQGALVRDIFVTNLHESFEHIQKRILKEKDPTLSEVILIAKSQRNIDNASWSRNLDSSSPSNSYWRTAVSSPSLSNSFEKLNMADHSRKKSNSPIEETKKITKVNSPSLSSSFEKLNLLETPHRKSNSPIDKANHSASRSYKDCKDEPKTDKELVSISETTESSETKRNCAPLDVNLPKIVPFVVQSLSERETVALPRIKSNGKTQKGVNARLSKHRVLPENYQSTDEILSTDPLNLFLGNFRPKQEKSCDNDASNSDYTTTNSSDPEKPTLREPVSLSKVLQNQALANSKNEINDRVEVSDDSSPRSSEEPQKSVAQVDANDQDPPQLNINRKLPLPRDSFSPVVVIYIPEGGRAVYVCPENKLPELQRIESTLGKHSKDSLEPVDEIAHNAKYAAPWQDEWYRAEVVAVQYKKQLVSVYFCDYGNTETVPLDDLRCLPKDFEDWEALAFPIQLPDDGKFPFLMYGTKLDVKPKYFDNDGNLVAEIELGSLYAPIK